ncbi:MAG: type II toxin-antitoxin system VapC family toxin [Parvibaculaceae bacterium]
MSLVIDSSLTLTWYFPDEANAATDALLRQVSQTGAVVPLHWHAEVANALQTAVRRKRIDPAYRDTALSELTHFDIVSDPDTNTHIWDATVKLADLYGLTIYDAAYLELSQRRRLPLATLDAALVSAAKAAGVAVLP